MHTFASSRGHNPLREQREAKKLTQVQLAVRVGCSLTTVSLAERCGYLSRQMARRFADALDCRPEDLLPTGDQEVAP